jgi:hypothetical protein
MTVSQLRAPGRVTGCVAQARRAVGEGVSIPAGVLSTHELGEAIAELSALESQVAAWRLRLAAEADVRRVADETADTDTTAWLTRLTADPREVAAGGLWLARRLDETYAATREAFAAGYLRIEQVRVIVRAAEKAPPGVTSEQLATAEAGLVAKATGAASRSGRPMNAKRLRQAARRMFDTISHDLADRHESEQLDAEADRAEHETWLTVHDNGDGTFSGRFVIPELHGNLLKTVLDRLTAPRHVIAGADGQPVIDPTLVSNPSWSERLGTAMVELIEHLPTDGFGAGNSVGVLVTVELEKLLSGIGAAGLDTGIRISAREARRLACNAGLIPAVLGGESQPLDLGRARRLHSGAQRKALGLLHDSCAVTTCERPFAWTEIHHRQPWSAGGRTDLDNGLPLCGHHHRRAHDSRFELRRHGDGDWRFHRRR